MQEAMEYLPFLISILIIELALAVTALVHVLGYPKITHFSNYLSDYMFNNCEVKK